MTRGTLNFPRRVRVRVPATTANLGPGFDCLGLALDLWNEAEFVLEGEGLHLECSGEGQMMRQQIPTDERNLVIQAMRFFCDERGLTFPRGLTVRCHNHVPVSSGLGSSAAATLLGLLGASALLGGPLSPVEALALAARMEGHPDNAAAAIMGGLVMVSPGKGGWLVRRVEVPVLRAVVVLPEVVLPTHEARAVLPGEVSLKDATFNLGRTALVIEALRSGDLELLGQALEDRLHVPYRLPLIPGGQPALEAGYQAGASAVTISGAGPSLIAFTPGDPSAVGAAMEGAFTERGIPCRTFVLQATNAGATVEEWE